MTEPAISSTSSVLGTIAHVVRLSIARLAAGAALGAVVAVGVSFAIPKRFVAETKFTVVSERASMSANRLAGFAAQFGIAAALSTPESPDFFAAIAGSRDAMLRMLDDTLCSGLQACPSVRQLIAATKDIPPREMQELRLRRLGKRVDVGVDARTGIITATAAGASPEEAEGILRAQLRAVSRLITERRESQARNERRFAEARLAQLRAQQRAVTDSLTYFYQSNRQFEGAPALRFRERGLQDRLGLWQELVQSVARQAETSRLEEVRDTPVLNVLEQPYASPRKVAPRRSLWLLGGLLIGALLALNPARLVRLIGEQTTAPHRTGPRR